MTAFGRSDDLHGTTFDRCDLTEARFVRADLARSEFVGADLLAARFVGADLMGVRMRAVDIGGSEIDSPWLFDNDVALEVNGVDVVPLIDAELNRRFPGRAERRANDPAGLRMAWAALELAWAALLDRVSALPDEVVDTSVDGEWSLAQTLRHLVMATDTWLRRAVLAVDQPYHPMGLPNTGAEHFGLDLSLFTSDAPFDKVLEVRAGRQAMMRDFLAAADVSELAEPRINPWNSEQTETVLSCLHTILDEEWEHYRYAVRDLDALS